MRRFSFAALTLLATIPLSRTVCAEFEPVEATVASIHDAYRSGELTARALTQMYLDRIDAYDQRGPALNAVILVNPRALERADELDRRFRESGRNLTGILHGVPVLLKDNVETADMPTTAGSRSLDGWHSGKDAFLTKKLRDAGAIIIAKVNLTEFAASGITKSSILGQTLNPYDLTRTPGGSSGGTGAGLAASFGVVGIGTDTVNSIRSPSSANSLVGIRPTRGLVSRAGVVPYALTQDMAGPLARTVADAAATLEAIAGYDPDDATTAWSVGRATSYREALDENALDGARIGILRTFFGHDGLHETVNVVTNRAIDTLRRRGAVLLDINDISDPLDADQLIAETNVSSFELDAHLSGYLKERGAPVSSLSEVLASGEYEPVLEQLFRNAVARDTETVEYKDRLLARHVLREHVMKLMADHELDALFYPHQKRLVVPLGEDQLDRNGVLGSITGFPAITVPGGFSERTESAPLGVPVGVEFLGRPFSEHVLIGLAHSFEQATQYRKPPATTPPLDD